jgi:NADH-quinone oxidoreductase subunit M
MSSLAFPGTNSFVGEVLVLAGTFEVNNWPASWPIPGAMLAAAYMLRLLQLVAWGEPSSFKKILAGPKRGMDLPAAPGLSGLLHRIRAWSGPAHDQPLHQDRADHRAGQEPGPGYRQDMPLAECMKLEPAAKVADGAAAGVSLPGKERL